jgi:hypothetical protein
MEWEEEEEGEEEDVLSPGELGVDAGPELEEGGREGERDGGMEGGRERGKG